MKPTLTKIAMAALLATGSLVLTHCASGPVSNSNRNRVFIVASPCSTS